MWEVFPFIGSYILHMNIMHWKHIWHTNKCVDGWNTNLWMNEYHMNFASSYKYVCQICFQCMISMWETYKLWINFFCTILIVKLWNVKFVMKGTKKHTKGCQIFFFWMLRRILKDEDCTMNDLRGVWKHEGDVINNLFWALKDNWGEGVCVYVCVCVCWKALTNEVFFQMLMNI